MSDTIRLSADARQALKSAIRAKALADGQDSVIGRPITAISNFTKAELLAAAAEVGVNVEEIAAASDNRESDVAVQDSDDTSALNTSSAASDVPDVLDSETKAKVDAEEQAILRAWQDMDVTAFRSKLRNVVERANQPAPVIVPSNNNAASPVASAIIGQTTLGQVFPTVTMPRAIKTHPVARWQTATPPAIDTHYAFGAFTGHVLAKAFKHHKPCLLVGPAGTGKTSLGQQIAARLGRPFALIPCDGQLDAAEMIGQTVPDANGGTRYQYGVLAQALLTPGCVLMIDEITSARAGVVMALQTVLAERRLYIRETGEVISAAHGVIILASDNTNGHGDTTGKYNTAGQLNLATLDRMALTVPLDYLPRDVEVKVLTAKTGCNATLAGLLVDFASLTRQAAMRGELTHGLGLRRLLSWSEELMDGFDPREAADLALVRGSDPEDHEKLRQLLASACSPSQIKAAIANVEQAAPTAAAATAFSKVEE